MARKIDILILGATGYTGRLITRYLATHPERSKFNMAIAGRSTNKLQALLQELNIHSTVDVYHLDISNETELDNLISSAKVVINCVGPFFIHSTPIVRSCARNGTHYCDITGEAHWIKDLITQYDYLARKNNTAIVPAAGQDSIPSDLAVYLSIRTGKQRFGPHTTFTWSKSGIWMPGAASGGTLSTLMSIFELVPKEKLKESHAPYSLSPIKGTPPPRTAFVSSLPFTSWVGGISIMKSINAKITEMTWGLHEQAKILHAHTLDQASLDLIPNAGPNFTYDEFGQVRRFGRLGGLIWSLSFVGFMTALALFSPLRWLVKKISHQTGSGPSDKANEKGTVDILNVTAVDEAQPKHVRSSVTFNVGAYVVTAVCASETALSLLLDHDKLPIVGKEGGLLTAIAACGDVLVQRLEQSGRLKWHSEIVEEADARKRV